VSNKSIYISDDAVWEKARKLAGKAGLSSVVQAAVEEYVRRGEMAAQGFKPYRLDVGYMFDADVDKSGFSECLTFDGRRLVGMETHMVASGSKDTPNLSPSDLLSVGEIYEVHVELYLTRAKNLIFTLDETGGGDAPTYYAVHDSVRSLREDPQVKRLPPLERAEFLRKVAKELGEDWAIAIP
jgi:hypothetical protein